MLEKLFAREFQRGPEDALRRLQRRAEEVHGAALERHKPEG